MKKNLWILLFVFICLIASSSSFAKPCGGCSQGIPIFKDGPSDQPKIITVYVKPGLLSDNIERIARENGWNRVIWNSSKNFNWVGYTKISARDLQGVMTKLLKTYPLQAVFYRGNRVLAIEPRTLK